MMNSGLHHIALNVTDVKAATEFYSKYFALIEIPRPNIGPGAWLQATDGRQIHLREGEVPEDNGQHLAFLVEDISEVWKALTDAGIAVTPPKAIGSALQSFLHDPAGNRLEIHQLG
tara:strand:+ start:298 stop:645 length:348 start_codon:yes stop_codon:yes gene_type:complete